MFRPVGTTYALKGQCHLGTGTSSKLHLRLLRNFPISLFSTFDDLMDDLLGGDISGQVSIRQQQDRFKEATSVDVVQLESSIPTETNADKNKCCGWKIIDWSKQKQSDAEEVHTTPTSPIDVVVVRGRVVYFKRDDQLRLCGSQLSGNKARKMLALHDLQPKEFPECIVSYGGPQSNAMLALAAVVQYQNDKLISSIKAQSTIEVNEDENNRIVNGSSNLKLDSSYKKRFVYYTKKLPKFLRNQPSGNLFRALALGMELVELSTTEYNTLFGGRWGGSEIPPHGLVPPVFGESVWIPQGGACTMAMRGIRVLAQEILSFYNMQGKRKPLAVCIPGGTCSTAYLVHRALCELQLEAPVGTNNIFDRSNDFADIKVVVIPCVGNDSYARRQMLNLNSQFNDRISSQFGIPSVLPPSPLSTQSTISTTYFGQSSREDINYFTFGEPDASVLDTYKEMRDEHGIVLDLLYGAPAWTLLLRHWRSWSNGTTARTQSKNENTESAIKETKLSAYVDAGPYLNQCLATDEEPLFGRDILYVHSGGLEGIASQLLRYKYKDLLNVFEVQLPE